MGRVQAVRLEVPWWLCRRNISASEKPKIPARQARPHHDIIVAAQCKPSWKLWKEDTFNGQVVHEMRPHGGLKEEEADDALWEAGRGAVAGAATWGFYTAALGAAAYAFSPIYRGLTIQFKVYIQMSGMILGGWTGADRRMREYEAKARLQRRMRIDRATWERFEKEFQEPPPPKPEK